MAASFFVLWQQDKTAHHSRPTAASMPILSYPQAAKPYFIIEVTIYYFKKFQFITSRSNDLFIQEVTIYTH